jgi:hypothetical protein
LVTAGLLLDFMEMIMSRRTIYLATAVAVLAAASSASAGGPKSGPSSGHVVVASQFGHGTVSGPVRDGRHGLEVRLPGGTWLDCGRSCSETLRTESVDFWENRGAGVGRSDHPNRLFGRLGRNY